MRKAKIVLWYWLGLLFWKPYEWTCWEWLGKCYGFCMCRSSELDEDNWYWEVVTPE